MNAGTIFVLVIVLALVALALRSVLAKKGCCSCGDAADASSSGSDCSGCSGCSGMTKVYGINVDAAGMSMNCDDGHCCHCSSEK